MMISASKFVLAAPQRAESSVGVCILLQNYLNNNNNRIAEAAYNANKLL